MRAAAFSFLLALMPGCALAHDASPGAGREDPCHDAVYARGRFTSGAGFSASAPQGYEAARDALSCTATRLGALHLGCSCSGGDHSRYISLGSELEQIRIAGDERRRTGRAPTPLTWYVDLEISIYKSDAKDGSLRVLRRSQTKLDTLPAQRIVMEYTTANGRQMTTDITVALRAADSGSADYEYVVALKSLAAHYPANRKILEEVLRSWHAIPIKSR